MNRNSKWTQGLMLLLMTLVMLIAAGCTSSDPVAPSDATITVLANPSVVFVNVSEGEESDTTSILAQVIDAGGVPAAGISILFTSTRGFMASTTNFCGPTGSCTLTGNVCISDGSCPGVIPKGVETDANGFALDILTVTQEDLGSVTVTATSGAATGAVEVTVSDGNLPPVVTITADQSFPVGVSTEVELFADVADPDGDVVTCYEWIENGTVVARGANVDSYTNAGGYNTQGEVEITVNVSDIFGIVCPGPGDPDPNPGIFTGSADLSFFVCTQGPTAAANVSGFNPGEDVTLQAQLGSPFAVNLEGNSSTAVGGFVVNAWDWDCDNGTSATGETGVVCTYTSPIVASTQQFDVELTVQDTNPLAECQQEDTDTITVTIQWTN